MNEQSDLWFEFLKALVTGGAIAAVFSLLTYVQNKRISAREAIFKALDSYLKVMDYRAAAIGMGENNGSWEAWSHYYRSLLDLQWSEYQIWRSKAFPKKQYEEWLRLRLRQFNEPEKKVRDCNGKEKVINYKIAWQELSNIMPVDLPYFDSADAFTTHMNLVHGNRIREAIKRKRGNQH
jgi:hypothetical protein